MRLAPSGLHALDTTHPAAPGSNSPGAGLHAGCPSNALTSTAKYPAMAGEKLAACARCVAVGDSLAYDIVG